MTQDKVTLCSSCETCPEVTLRNNEIWIGEEGTLAKLTKESWNQLVAGVQKGNLKKVEG